jgi:uncharacterized iron-regulated protein
MKDEKNTVKDLMVINPTSKVGKLIKAEEYDDFVALLKKEDNVADAIINANRDIAIKLQIGIDAKNVIDTVAKPMKNAVANFRKHITRYMEENDLEKLEGDTKNITFQPAKETKGVVAHPQIKVGSKYVDIKELTKEDLVEQLKNLGVKTRIRNEDKTAVKPAGITVPK